MQKRTSRKRPKRLGSRPRLYEHELGLWPWARPDSTVSSEDQEVSRMVQSYWVKQSPEKNGLDNRGPLNLTSRAHTVWRLAVLAYGCTLGL